MAIYNKTWTADEEITYSKLNQMSADIVNSVDDIHKQYNERKAFSGAYQVVAVSGLADSTGYLYSYREQSVDIVNLIDELKYNNTGSLSLAMTQCVARLGIKLKASQSITNAYINFKAGLSAGISGGTQNVRVSVAKNGTSLSYVTRTPTAVYTSWDTYTESVSLATPSAGDFIDVAISLYAAVNGASLNASVFIKDIEIYLS